MNKKEFYGPSYGKLRQAESRTLELLRRYTEDCKEEGEDSPIVYTCSRIKSPESMRRKLEARGLPVNSQSALTQVHDAVGVRIICSFLDDVYRVVQWIETRTEWRILQRKDYIAQPKPNGYRSYHIIVELADGPGKGMTVEIQVRTIAIDCWATLEHQMKYKREISHEALVRRELKRCADEMASVDLSMQTIRELLAGPFSSEGRSGPVRREGTRGLGRLGTLNQERAAARQR